MRVIRVMRDSRVIRVIMVRWVIMVARLSGLF